MKEHKVYLPQKGGRERSEKRFRGLKNIESRLSKKVKQASKASFAYSLDLEERWNDKAH
jgi:hypothetical protein